MKQNIPVDKMGMFYQEFMKIKHRGPEYSSFDLITNNAILGFHRLAIMDTTAEGHQPFHYVRKDGSCVYSICNGEIYDVDKIKAKYNIQTKSHSDCEVIIPLYEMMGIEQTAKLLGSEFACIIFDIDKNGQIKVSAARDPVGIRPLHYALLDDGIIFSSELKALSCLSENVYIFPPGHYMIYENETLTIEPFYSFKSHIKSTEEISLKEAENKLQELLINSVKRKLCSDRPIGALLSGGLDSSLIVGILRYLMPEAKIPVFTVAFKNGSNDLPFAKLVAEQLNLDHHVVLVTEEEALSMIDDTIKTLDTFDITTIRASTFQNIIAKYISENTDIKVIFSGELSDEIFQSYKYFHNAPSPKAGREEAIRLVNNVSQYDVKRTDGTMTRRGLEVRVPFADMDLIEFVFNLPYEYTQPHNGLEKALLRNAFREMNIMPLSVCDRVKDAFSDSVSLQERSWFSIIQEYIDNKVSDQEFEENKDKYQHCTPFTKESYYYRKKFVEFTNGNKTTAETIPYFWMPKWCDGANDPSARTISTKN